MFQTTNQIILLHFFSNFEAKEETIPQRVQAAPQYACLHFLPFWRTTIVCRFPKAKSMSPLKMHPVKHHDTGYRSNKKQLGVRFSHAQKPLVFPQKRIRDKPGWCVLSKKFLGSRELILIFIYGNPSSIKLAKKTTLQQTNPKAKQNPAQTEAQTS